MRALLNELGNPQDCYPIIHVGGTAGKGSTASIASSILVSAGYKTGLHVSPHLQDIRERAQVNGALMTKDNFVRLANLVKRNVELVEEKYDYGRPSYFEALLALAFQHFKEEKVQVGVIEVGLGGTLDGTNVVKSKVAILTMSGSTTRRYSARPCRG